MSPISFSEFAKLLHMYCAIGATQEECVITLTNRIMAGRPGVAKGDGYKNPMIGKDVRSLQQYYSGSRPIPKNIASAILRNSDKYRFEVYLRECSDGSLKLVDDELSKFLTDEEDYKSLDTAGKCAELFEKILKDCACPKKNPK